MTFDGETRYGFRWGPMEVTRGATLERSSGTARCVMVKTDAGKSIDIYVSPAGQSIRVFSEGKEWKP